MTPAPPPRARPRPPPSSTCARSAGTGTPAARNEDAFRTAIDEISAATERLLAALGTAVAEGPDPFADPVARRAIVAPDRRRGRAHERHDFRPHAADRASRPGPHVVAAAGSGRPRRASRAQRRGPRGARARARGAAVRLRPRPSRRERARAPGGARAGRRCRTSRGSRSRPARTRGPRGPARLGEPGTPDGVGHRRLLAGRGPARAGERLARRGDQPHRHQRLASGTWTCCSPTRSTSTSTRSARSSAWVGGRPAGPSASASTPVRAPATRSTSHTRGERPTKFGVTEDRLDDAIAAVAPPSTSSWTPSTSTPGRGGSATSSTASRRRSPGRPGSWTGCSRPASRSARSTSAAGWARSPVTSERPVDLDAYAADDRPPPGAVRGDGRLRAGRPRDEGRGRAPGRGRHRGAPGRHDVRRARHRLERQLRVLHLPVRAGDPPAAAIRSASGPQLVTIAGHINEAGDLFAEDYPFPDVAEGDAVAILNAGGYLMAMSMTHCLRPTGKAIYLQREVTA